MSEPQAFSGWVYISKAEDVPGCWVAHCIDFNIISTGDSPNHALEMVHEAVGTALADDLSRGLDPNARRSECSSEDWNPLLQLMNRHTKVPVREMDAAATSFKEFAVPITVVVADSPGAGIETNAALDVHGEALRAA